MPGIRVSMRSFLLVMSGLGLLLSCSESEVAECKPACGEGLSCVLEDQKSVCRPVRPDAILVRIASPQEGSLHSDSLLEVECEARAPQLEEVVLLVIPPSPESAISVPARDVGDGRWSARYTSAMGASVDGTHVLRCEARFGPPAHGNAVRSAEHRVHVDRSPPSIEHDTSERWYQPDADVRIVATVRDETPDGSASGLDRSSVVLVIDDDLDIFSHSDSGDSFEFRIDLAALVPEDFVGSVPYVIQAADKLGNVGTSRHLLRIDGVTPKLTIDEEAAGQWHARSASLVRVPLHIERASGGAPLSGPPLVHDESGRLLTTGEKDDERWLLPFVPAELVDGDEEKEIHWVASAENAAGLTGDVEGTLRIDGRAPSVTVVEISDWVRRGGFAEIVLSASDSGSGLDASSFAVGEPPELADCTAISDDNFRCRIPTDAAPEGMEGEHEIDVFVADRTGNAFHLLLSVPVDGRGPILSLTSEESSWLPALESAQVLVHASDEGSGTARVHVVQGEAERECEASEEPDVWSCVVDTSHVVESTSSHSLVVVAEDALGNVTEWSTSIRVDAHPPTITFDDPSEWFDATAIPPLKFVVEDADSGVAHVSLELDAIVSECALATGPNASESSWECPVTPAVREDGEWLLPYLVRATDSAGQLAEEGGTLRIDSLAPRVDFPHALGWVARDGLVPVTVTIVDDGVGVDPGSAVVIDDSDSRDCEHVRDDEFVCVVDSSLAVKGQTSELPFRIRVRDRLGNLRTRHSHLPVDDEGPEITFHTIPNGWLSMGAGNVTMAVVDSGAGIESPHLVTQMVPKGAQALSTAPLTPSPFGSSGVRFIVEPATFLSPNQTIRDFPFEVTVVDKLGNTTVRTLLVSFDGEPPYVELDVIPYPPGSGARFNRRAGEIELFATVADPGWSSGGGSVNGSGINPGRVHLKYTRAIDTTRSLAGESIGNHRYRWTFDTRDPLFDAVEGEVELSIEAYDNVGNVFVEHRPLRLTRKRWEKSVAPGTVTSWGSALADDQLFILSQDSQTQIIALDANSGQERWRDDLGYSMLQHALVDGELLHVISGADSSAELRSYRRSPSGNTPVVEHRYGIGMTPWGRLALANWSWDPGAMPVPTLLIATQNAIRAAWFDGANSNVFTILAGETYGLSLSNRRIWHGNVISNVTDYDPINRTHSTTTLPSVSGFPWAYALVNQTAWANDNGMLIHWSNQGQILHEKRIAPASVPMQSPVVVGSDQQPWWISTDGDVTRYSSSLDEMPGFPVSLSGASNAGLNAPTLGVDGTAYLVHDGWVHAVRPDGSVSWTHDLGARANALQDSPLLGCDGTLYVGTNDGRVVALSTDSDGLSEGWPRQFRDNRNTNSTLLPIRVGNDCVP